MIELSIAQRWLFAKLNANPTLTGRVRGGAIYPEEVEAPIVTFSFIPESGDVQLNRVIGGRAALVRLTFEVKVQERTNTFANLTPMATAINQSLDLMTNEVLDGHNITCLRRGLTQNTYFLINEQYREMGGTYFIFLSKI